MPLTESFGPPSPRLGIEGPSGSLPPAPPALRLGVDLQAGPLLPPTAPPPRSGRRRQPAAPWMRRAPPVRPPFPFHRRPGPKRRPTVAPGLRLVEGGPQLCSAEESAAPDSGGSAQCQVGPTHSAALSDQRHPLRASPPKRRRRDRGRDCGRHPVPSRRRWRRRRPTRLARRAPTPQGLRAGARQPEAEARLLMFSGGNPRAMPGSAAPLA
jgi:hypothetical protein